MALFRYNTNTGGCRTLILGNHLFNERKVTHMAAYFLKQGGGQMSHLKLMKLLYLADREAMRRSGFPMSGDRLVSMPHGPVLIARTSIVLSGKTPMVRQFPYVPKTSFWHLACLEKMQRTWLGALRNSGI